MLSDDSHGGVQMEPLRVTTAISSKAWSPSTFTAASVRIGDEAFARRHRRPSAAQISGKRANRPAVRGDRFFSRRGMDVAHGDCIVASWSSGYRQRVPCSRTAAQRHILEHIRTRPDPPSPRAHASPERSVSRPPRRH